VTDPKNGKVVPLRPIGDEDEDEREFNALRRRSGGHDTRRPAAVKRKETAAEPFVRVPLWWARLAAKATRTPKALVWVELLYASWKAQSPTVTFPNARLRRQGVSDHSRSQALRELAADRLVTIEWRQGKNPLVTLIAICG
jgi:hypothetical protein